MGAAYVAGGMEQENEALFAEDPSCDIQALEYGEQEAYRTEQCRRILMTLLPPSRRTCPKLIGDRSRSNLSKSSILQGLSHNQARNTEFHRMLLDVEMGHR